jgi:N-acetyl-anhydromuramyl-L-alanine amidase AmpD
MTFEENANDKRGYPFVQAKNYTLVSQDKPRKLDLLVIHTMEALEKPATATNVALWFASSTAPKASAHFCIDDNHVIQCVRVQDVAWHAPGANNNGIGLEHAGYASQTSADWQDVYSQNVLLNSANLAGELCLAFSIPAEFVDAAGLRAGKRGITTHAEVTKAFPGPGRTHWDPGPNFPMEEYLELVLAGMGLSIDLSDTGENIA